MRNILLYGILAISILNIIILFFFESYRLPMVVNLNHDKINKLLEIFSLSYITSFIFYLIVVRLHENNNQNRVLAILEEPMRSLIDSTCSIYKNYNSQGNVDAIEIEEFFKQVIPTCLDNVADYNSVSNGTKITNGGIQQISFISWLKKINDSFISDGGELVKHYGIFLDVKFISLFEELKVTDYTRLINSANLLPINNLSDLDIPGKYKAHHEIILKIVTKIFSRKRIFIGHKEGRYILIKKPYINKFFK